MVRSDRCVAVFHQLCATEAARRIRCGELSALDYAEALLERCSALESLGAFIRLDADTIRADARAADLARGQGAVLGPLHGVAVTVKDNIDVAGLPTTAGAAGLRGNVAREDAEVVRALRRAGAVIFGKTNMHELAYGLTSNNAFFGPVRNPLAPTRIAGGSSGGAAAALAAGLAPLGLGTDTGGSVRQPAALCGVVGLRPTLGRYSASGVLPISHTRDTVGAMARTVEDVALLDAAITGCSVELEAIALPGLRLGVPREYFYDPLDADVRDVVERALRHLAAAGVELVQVEIPEVRGSNPRIGRPIFMAEAIGDIGGYLAGRSCRTTVEALFESLASPDVRRVFAQQLDPEERALRAAEYRDAIDRDRPALVAAYRRCFERHRVAALIFPTTPIAACLLGEDATVELAGQRMPTTAAYVRNTGPATIVGIPGLSVPAGRTPTGLPVGIELDGPWWSDRKLLAIGRAIEASLVSADRCGRGVDSA